MDNSVTCAQCLEKFSSKDGYMLHAQATHHSGTHQFTIPVEWKIVDGDLEHTDEFGRFVQPFTSVTKLRCNCGEEIKRNA